MKSGRTAAGSGRIRGLDGVRTLALAGVLLFHMFPRAVPGGYFGVITFFVISGFLTAYASVRRGKTPVLSYYGKRIARIYPSLIIMLFISVEIISLVDKFRLLNVQEEVLSVLLAYNNYWQISKSADYFANLSANSAFTHLWYTSILIQFELIWPWLYRLLSWMKKGLAVFGVLVVLSLCVMPFGTLVDGISQSMLYYGTLCRIHALLVGAWVGWRAALFERDNDLQLRTPFTLVTVSAFFAVSVYLFATASGDKPYVYQYGIVLYSLACGFTVMVLSQSSGMIGSLLDNPVCRFLSRYSYEIYLWQYPVLFVFGLWGMNTQPWHYILQLMILLLLSVWIYGFVAFMKKLFA